MTFLALIREILFEKGWAARVVNNTTSISLLIFSCVTVLNFLEKAEGAPEKLLKKFKGGRLFAVCGRRYVLDVL